MVAYYYLYVPSKDGSVERCKEVCARRPLREETRDDGTIIIKDIIKRGVKAVQRCNGRSGRRRRKR